MSEFRIGLRRHALALAMGLAAVLGVPVASAAPVLVRDGNGAGPFNGNGLGAPLALAVKVRGVDQSVLAAPFRLQQSTDGGGTWTNLLAYSLEPDETLSVTATPTAGNRRISLSLSPLYDSVADSIGRLYRTHFEDSLTSATKAAAFQIALWELAFDTGSNLGGGRFRLVTPGAVAGQAAAYLDTANWLLTGDVGVIQRAGNQDLLWGPRGRLPVPEPATLALFGLGLGTLVALRRRRAA